MTLELGKSELREVAGFAVAVELAAGDDPAVGAAHIGQSRELANRVVVEVLRR